MSTTLYRDTGAPLIGLIEDIRTGRLALPDIQRPFVWASKKVRDLFDSMYRGYPIGNLGLLGFSWGPPGLAGVKGGRRPA